MQGADGALTKERFDAVLFDLDGVLTDTARVHAASWKATFDAFLEEHSKRTGESQPPFEIDPDYHVYVDGKPRYDGVRSFLESRGIELPEGDPRDPPGSNSICALGNRKNVRVGEAIAAGRVAPYPGSLRLVRHLLDLGIRCAVVSASSNCPAVLAAAGIAELFEARVDGEVVRDLGLAGKPAPDSFLEAARRLDASPDRCAVVEDAIAGVEAGRDGNFALVVGVARKGDAAALAAHGAGLVVEDLSELLPADRISRLE